VALGQAFLMLSHISIISHFSVFVFHPSAIDTVQQSCQKCSPESFINVAHLHLIFINFLLSIILNTKTDMLSEYWNHFCQSVTCLPIAWAFYIYEPEGCCGFYSALH